MVLSRVRKHGTRTQGTAIPERIHTIVLDYRLLIVDVLDDDEEAMS